MARAGASASSLSILAALLLTALLLYLHQSNTPPAQRHEQAKAHVIADLNRARLAVGGSALQIGTNDAPQLHAENMLTHCYTSHWDTQGRPPHLRYAQHGGLAHNGENVFSDNECGYPDTNTQNNPGTAAAADMALTALLNSPGHRLTMLDPAFTKVSVGLAWNAHTYKAVHQFESEAPTMPAPPSITDGELTLHLPPQAHLLGQDQSLWYLAIHHQDPPLPKDRNALRLTGCYDIGQPVAIILPGIPAASEPRVHNLTVRSLDCPPPAAPAASVPTPATAAELADHHIKRSNAAPRKQPLQLREIKPGTWETTTQGTTISADLSAFTTSLGPGIYTIVLATTQKGIRPSHRYILQFALLWPQDDRR